MEPFDDSAEAAEAADRSLGLSAGWVSLFTKRGFERTASLVKMEKNADSSVCRSHL